LYEEGYFHKATSLEKRSKSTINLPRMHPSSLRKLREYSNNEIAYPSKRHFVPAKPHDQINMNLYKEGIIHLKKGRNFSYFTANVKPDTKSINNSPERTEKLVSVLDMPIYPNSK
jgi:hypothetical protein